VHGAGEARWLTVTWPPGDDQPGAMVLLLPDDDRQAGAITRGLANVIAPERRATATWRVVVGGTQFEATTD
jgi:hypothetical protein